LRPRGPRYAGACAHTRVVGGLEHFLVAVLVHTCAAGAQYDRDGDGKLSFEEWRLYANDDPDLRRLTEASRTK
jgi:hypothetical protein